MGHDRFIFRIIYLTVALIPSVGYGVQANITIDGASRGDIPYVYPTGQLFSIDISVDRPSISCRWHDFRGQSQGPPIFLSAASQTTVRAPSSETGYYGLRCSSSDSDITLPGRVSGEPREYGFAVLPAVDIAGREIDSSSPFGMVHAHLEDAHLAGWVKTRWSPQYTSPGATDVNTVGFASDMAKARSLGLIELPLLTGSGWRSDDTQGVSKTFLTGLETTMTRFFQADPQVDHWELGLEENIKPFYADAFYWQNLLAKTSAVRKAADAANPDIKLLYQIAGLNIAGVENFFETGVARKFDILALHPYAWPDFRAPETWLKRYIDEVKSVMTASSNVMPIWFTEVGAPHHGNCPECPLMSGKNPVTGLPLDGMAIYLVKIFVTALHLGVEKIFWYNYQDRCSVRSNAECNFGIKDSAGFPKPAYVSQYVLVDYLSNKTPTDASTSAGGIHIYGFQGASEETLVVWQYPAENARDVPLSTIRAGLSSRRVIDVVDTVGTPKALDGESIRVTGAPLFLTIESAHSESQTPMPTDSSGIATTLPTTGRQGRLVTP